MTTIKASGRDLELKGDQDIVFYPTQNIWISQGTKLVFEGTVPDDHEAKLQATAVTADRDIILPDADGTITLNEKLSDGSFDMNVNSLTVTGTGSTSVIQASQDIELDAAGAVIVKDTPLRLASLTTTQRNALTPTNGDMIYNTTTNQFEIYRNGAWETNATTESLVDSAPSTLDTLNELAAALGDDPNFATTTATNLGLKLNTADFTSTANTWLATQSTTNVSEGTNLYFTNTRADARADARIANNIIDEDSMATNSATRAPSQQSVKAYVDANAGGAGATMVLAQNGTLSLNTGDVLTLAGTEPYNNTANSVGLVIYKNGDFNDRLVNKNVQPGHTEVYTAAANYVNVGWSYASGFLPFLERA